MALAPNLTVLLGELVGARLVAHAGKKLFSLLNKGGFLDCNDVFC